MHLYTEYPGVSLQDKRVDAAHEIKRKITSLTLTYTWLIQQLSNEGIYTDKFELSSVLAGTRKGPKADDILQCSLTLLREYETKVMS